MKNTDVGWSSFYLVLRANGVFELTAGWDFDLSSGNDIRVDNASYKNLYVGRSNPLIKQSNPLFYGLMECPFFQKLAAGRWRELSEAVDSCFNTLIDTVVSRYETDFVYDRTLYRNVRQNSNTYVVTPAGTAKKIFEANIEYYTGWLTNRRAWLDSYFA